jgi:hypothetical protein
VKLSKEKYIEVCFTSRKTPGYKSCVRRTCKCESSKTTTRGLNIGVTTTRGLNTGGAELVCSDKIYNYTLCKNDNDTESSTNGYHQGFTTPLDLPKSSEASADLEISTISAIKNRFLDGKHQCTN